MQLIIKNESDLYRRLDSLSDVFKKTFWVGVQEDLEKNLLRNIKPHSKTGKLERNAYVKIIPNGVEAGIENEGMMVDWRGTRKNYGVFVHEGTRPHIIKPKKKKSLRWSPPGGDVFAKEVHHPGYKGDPYLYNAAQETFNRLDKIFREELHKKGIT